MKKIEVTMTLEVREEAVIGRELVEARQFIDNFVFDNDETVVKRTYSPYSVTTNKRIMYALKADESLRGYSFDYLYISKLATMRYPLSIFVMLLRDKGLSELQDSIEYF